MKLETITKKLDGLKFYIQQFPARKCLKLEKRTITIVSPMLYMLEGAKNLDTDIEIGGIIKGIQKALLDLDDNTFDEYIADMMEYTAVEIKTKDGKSMGTESLKNEDIFDTVFIGKNMTVYKLLIAIMKANKFAFFGLVGGKGLNLISIFSKAKQETPK